MKRNETECNNEQTSHSHAEAIWQTDDAEEEHCIEINKQSNLNAYTNSGEYLFDRERTRKKEREV